MVAVLEAMEVEEGVIEVMTIGKTRGIRTSQKPERREKMIRN